MIIYFEVAFSGIFVIMISYTVKRSHCFVLTSQIKKTYHRLPSSVFESWMNTSVFAPLVCVFRSVRQTVRAWDCVFVCQSCFVTIVLSWSIRILTGKNR